MFWLIILGLILGYLLSKKNRVAYTLIGGFVGFVLSFSVALIGFTMLALIVFVVWVIHKEVFKDLIGKLK